MSDPLEIWMVAQDNYEAFGDQQNRSSATRIFRTSVQQGTTNREVKIR